MRAASAYRSRKRGFTLIEIVLVMAILVFMIGTFFAVFNIINVSHANIAVKNDAKDYVELNMEAITNLIVNADGIKICSDSTKLLSGTDDAYTNSLYYDAGLKDGILYFDSKTTGEHTSAFTYYQYTVGNPGKNKWYIVPTFSINADNPSVVVINLQVMDNAKPSTQPPYTTLSRSVYLPNLKNGVASTGNIIKLHRTNFG